MINLLEKINLYQHLAIKKLAEVTEVTSANFDIFKKRLGTPGLGIDTSKISNESLRNWTVHNNIGQSLIGKWLLSRTPTGQAFIFKDVGNKRYLLCLEKDAESLDEYADEQQEKGFEIDYTDELSRSYLSRSDGMPALYSMTLSKEEPEEEDEEEDKEKGGFTSWIKSIFQPSPSQSPSQKIEKKDISSIKEDDIREAYRTVGDIIDSDVVSIN